MSFKKSLLSHNTKIYSPKSGQTVIEYVVLTIVFIMAVILVFGGFNPDNLKPSDEVTFGPGLTAVFRNAVTGAISRVANWN